MANPNTPPQNSNGEDVPERNTPTSFDDMTDEELGAAASRAGLGFGITVNPETNLYPYMGPEELSEPSI